MLTNHLFRYGQGKNNSPKPSKDSLRGLYASNARLVVYTPSMGQTPLSIDSKPLRGMWELLHEIVHYIMDGGDDLGDSAYTDRNIMHGQSWAFGETDETEPAPSSQLRLALRAFAIQLNQDYEEEQRQ